MSNFEEIVNFFEENNREPQHASTDIKEFQLYCRLKAIRESAEMVKELKDFDFMVCFPVAIYLILLLMIL